MTPLLLVPMALLMIASAVLSAAEAAVFSVSTSNLRTLQDEGFQGAEELNRLRDRGEAVRAVALLISTVLNTIAAGLGVAVAWGAWGTPGVAVGIFGASLVVVLVAEAAPRLLGARRPVKMALGSAPGLLRLERWLRPLLAPLAGLRGRLAKSNGEAPATPEERALMEITSLGQEVGVVGEDENLLVERAFRLDELVAWDVMTPRVDIFAWKDSLTLEDIVGELKGMPYSRVPVYGEGVDEVTGILYVREAYQSYVAGHASLPLSRLSRDPFFVPGSMPLTTLLRSFQARRIHMGIVADEFGGTDGLVTLEDILEELVGEIHDETDVAKPDLFRISRTEILVSGSTDLRELNYAFNVSFPHLEYRSLNGFILEELGRVPEAGELLTRPDAVIEIVEASDTQVLRARIRKPGAPETVEPTP